MKMASRKTVPRESIFNTHSSSCTLYFHLRFSNIENGRVNNDAVVFMGKENLNVSAPFDAHVTHLRDFYEFQNRIQYYFELVEQLLQLPLLFLIRPQIALPHTTKAITHPQNSSHFMFVSIFRIAHRLINANASWVQLQKSKITLKLN